MEPAKMKTHHGYFLGKPMSAVGTKRTDLPPEVYMPSVKFTIRLSH